MINRSLKIKVGIVVGIVLIAGILTVFLYKRNSVPNTISENTQVETVSTNPTVTTTDNTKTESIPVTAPTVKKPVVKTTVATKPAVTVGPVLLDLYSKYKDGSIAECNYNGSLVYKASVNAADAGSTIYNGRGYGIGWIGGGGSADAVASATKDCKDVYVVATNVWSKSSINIYNLK